MKILWIASGLILVAMLSVSSGEALASSNIVPVTYNGKTFNVNATLDSGTIKNMTIDQNFTSLVITLDQNTTKDGTFTIDLPRAMIDAKVNATDDTFIVLNDGVQTNATELLTNNLQREISFNVPSGTSQIEIIGTQVTPEFPSWSLIVLIPLAFGMATVIGKRSKIKLG